MESRSRRRLGSRPPRGARRRNDQGADGDGVDRISGLHDDLLLLVLARLRCARAAARTSVLSSRWSDLWMRLPELYFRDSMSPSTLEAALAKVAVPKLSVLDMAVSRHADDRRSFSAAAVASLLRNAARLNPVELSVEVRLKVKDRGRAVELPCFAGATSVNLDLLGDLNLTLPAQGGEFPVLERLSIGGCFVNTGALISRCPNLRVLNLNECLNDGPLTVHSTTIEELTVNIYSTGIQSVDIVAPVLKKFIWSGYLHKDFTMSLTAPMVGHNSWICGWPGFDLMIDQTWCLDHLMVETEESGCMVLRLTILRPKHFVSHQRKLQEIFQFPRCSVLELYLEGTPHFYGGIVLNILRICNGIRSLKLTANYWRDVHECPPNCPCDQPQNWRSWNILFPGLEEVEIVDFNGSGHEVDFMKLLFRCAPLTKVIVKLESKVSMRSKGCKEIYNLFKANPTVECNVYQKRGKEVVYA